MSPERCHAIVRRVQIVAIVSLLFEAPAALMAVFIAWRFAAIATIACAILTMAAFYAAYEGFDANLRRPR